MNTEIYGFADAPRVRLTCPSCGRRLTAVAEPVGRSVRCPCGHALRVGIQGEDRSVRQEFERLLLAAYDGALVGAMAGLCYGRYTGIGLACMFAAASAVYVFCADYPVPRRSTVTRRGWGFAAVVVGFAAWSPAARSLFDRIFN